MSDVGTVKRLEGRLRPIYEWYECVIQFLATIALYYLAVPFGMTPLLRNIVIVISLGWITHRYRQGKKIRLYQKSLRKIEPYVITPGTIEHNNDETWIGKGFEFTGVHAQRVWDAEKNKYKKYYAQPKAYLKARKNEHDVKQGLKNKTITATSKIARKAKFTKEREHNLDSFVQLLFKRGNSIDEIIEHEGPLPKIYKKLNKYKIKNKIAPLPNVGGRAHIHGVGYEEETDQHLELDERNGHGICFGQSRVGKTKWLEVIITQDIQRNDGPVILTDPKGDSALLARAWAEAKRAGREDNFFVFALGFPDISCKYNAIATFSRITSVASRIADPMSGSGDGAVFKDFAWRFLLIVAHAMNEIGEKPSFKAVKRYIEDMEPIYLKYSEIYMDEHIPKWREQVDSIKNPPDVMIASGEMRPGKFTIPPHFKGRSKEMVARDIVIGRFFENNPSFEIDVAMEGLRSAMKNEMQYYNKITASLIPLLTKLTSGRIAELVSPDYSDVHDERPEINWQQVIQTNSIVVVLADAMTDPMTANAVVGMMFSDLLSQAGDIYKNGFNKGLHKSDMSAIKPIWIHIDEFHSVLKGGADGEPFQSILNRSAGAGVRIMAYTQTLDDIEDATGSATAAAVILGNFNSTFMMRVKTEKTAEYLTQAVEKSDRYDISLTGMTGGAGKGLADEDDIKYGKTSAEFFSSRNSSTVETEAYEPLITSQMILTLPKGQAFALINGARLLKLRFPLLEEDDGFVPPTLQTMIGSMKEKYQRDDESEFTFE